MSEIKMAIAAENLTLEFPTGRGKAPVRAVDGVTVEVPQGSILSIVGESGSGKTTLSRLLAGFYQPTSGRILVGGEPIPKGGTSTLAYRSRVQLMFQDPFASLNPVHTVFHTVSRAYVRHHSRLSKAALREAVLDVLRRVRLEPAEDYIDKYPHEMSGGQRQRVVLARALAVEPTLLLADEPVSMLDVSIRAEMLNLLRRLRDEEDLSIVYVTHDIASARYISDRIAVMYRGRIVEQGWADDVVRAPQHAYTRTLIDAAPDPERVAQTSRSERFGIAAPQLSTNHAPLEEI